MLSDRPRVSLLHLVADRQTLCCFQICYDTMVLFGALPAIDILWSSQEASLLDIVDRACGLFTPEEVGLAYLTLIRSFQFFWPGCILYRCLCGGLGLAATNDATNINCQILETE